MIRMMECSDVFIICFVSQISLTFLGRPAKSSDTTQSKEGSPWIEWGMQNQDKLRGITPSSHRKTSHTQSLVRLRKRSTYRGLRTTHQFSSLHLSSHINLIEMRSKSSLERISVEYTQK